MQQHRPDTDSNARAAATTWLRHRRRLLSTVVVLCSTVLSCKSGSDDNAATGKQTPSAEGKQTPKETPEPSAPATTSTEAPAPAKAEKRYDVESGRVEYALDGMQVGKETMRFKNFGVREVRNTEAKLTMPPGVKMPIANKTEQTVTVIEGTTTTTYNPVNKTGTRILNTLEVVGGRERLAGSAKQLGMAMMKEMGGKQVGTSSVAGLACELWTIEKIGLEACIHKGVTLEATVTLVGMKQHSVATKVDFDAKIDDSAFAIPKDVKLKERDLAKQDLLGNPRGAGTQGTLTPAEVLERLGQQK